MRPFLSAVLLLAVSAAARAGVVFTDVTSSCGVNMTGSPAPAGVPGTSEWMMAGACIGDFNRDGWPDIFVLQGGTAPDKLFINNGDGTFTDRAVEWGVAATHCGSGTAVGDVDHDGWPDIFVTSFGNGSNNQGQMGKNRLYRNNGNGTFTDIAVVAGVNQNSTIASACNGSSWGDIDLDGDLDLFVSAWSQTAQGNRLYRNNGNGTFTDVTGIAITVPIITWGFQPSFVDLDGDGYPELSLAADFQTSRLYKNNRDGTFTDVTLLWGAAVDKNGMGQCSADFDRDGDIDAYVTSIYQDIPSHPRLHNGNAFYVNQGDGHLSEVSATNGTQDGGWGWGVVAGDFDLDGWPDMVEVNGRNAAEWADESEYFFRNLGNGTFLRDRVVSDMFLAGDGRTVVSFDYDHDGDLDLAIYYNFGPLKIYRNDSTGVGRWLEIDLAAGSNPRVPSFGYGALVTARIGTTKFIRFVDGGYGYLGSSELMVHFGVGDAPMIDELTVRWPRGNVSTILNQPTGQRITITAPSLADLNGDGHVNSADLALLLGAWGPVDPIARFVDLDDDGAVGPSDLAILLGAWAP